MTPTDPGSSEALARDPAALRDALIAHEPLAAADPAAVRVVRAPGRVNLIGEHTDYNEGFVLPVAIDLGISIALVPTDDGRAALTLAATGETGMFDVADVGPRRGSWLDYVAGMAWALAAAGIAPRGFRGLLASDLPQGAGLSSSAAIEVVVCLGVVRRRSAAHRPDGPRARRPAWRERLHRAQQRDHGPVRVDLRRARPGAAARLPVARAPVDPAATRRRRARRLQLGLRAQARDVGLQRAPLAVRGGRGADRQNSSPACARCAT